MLDSRSRSALCAACLCLLPLLAERAASEPLGEGARLCLYPLQLPLSEGEAEKRRPLIGRLLTAALADASLAVTDPTAVEALEERVRQQSGGFIDAPTGNRDGARYLAYRERLGAALREELGCDARLYASVVTLRAAFTSGIARWDGVTRQVSSTGRIVMAVLAGVQESGWVSAFSLWLRVTDLLGNDVAFRSAGIETPVQFAVLEDKDLVPEDLWLTDEARLDEAIRSALGPGGRSLRHDGRP